MSVFFVSDTSTPIYKIARQYRKKDMEAALTAVREKKMGYLKASIKYNVPKSSLYRISQRKDTSLDDLLSRKIGRQPLFDEQFENELVEHALQIENLTDIRRLAFNLAKKQNKPNPFKDKMPGRYWLKSFLNRHKDRLSSRVDKVS